MADIASTPIFDAFTDLKNLEEDLESIRDDPGIQPDSKRKIRGKLYLNLYPIKPSMKIDLERLGISLCHGLSFREYSACLAPLFEMFIKNC